MQNAQEPSGPSPSDRVQVFIGMCPKERLYPFEDGGKLVRGSKLRTVDRHAYLDEKGIVRLFLFLVGRLVGLIQKSP